MIEIQVGGEVALTMTREQAEACYARLLELPFREASRQEYVECFLICQLADALGYGAKVPRWMRERAAVVA